MTNINENEYKEYKLEDICEISRGKVYSKTYLQLHRGVYPVYSSQTSNNGIFGKIDTYDYDGEYVTWTTDGVYAGSIFYRHGKFSITNICGLLKIKNSSLLSAKYLSYILAIKAKEKVNHSSANPKLMSNVMAKIKIPIPPLEIQQKIVKILDDFNKLEAELEAELEARKKQYEYYRDMLLNINNIEERERERDD